MIDPSNNKLTEMTLIEQLDFSPKEKHREEVVRKKIDSAKEGNELSGRAILQDAATALYLITKNKPIDRGEYVGLRFIHEALRDYLDKDIPIERALCIENEGRGRPRKVDVSIFLVLEMDREIDKQLKRGEELSIERATERVANEESVSASLVNKAWLKYGGKGGYERRKKLLNERFM